MTPAKPWWKQYWYIWVPILLLLMTQGTEEPPKAQGQRAGQGNAGGGAAASSGQTGSNVRVGMAR